MLRLLQQRPQQFRGEMYLFFAALRVRQRQPQVIPAKRNQQIGVVLAADFLNRVARPGLTGRIILKNLALFGLGHKLFVFQNTIFFSSRHKTIVAENGKNSTISGLFLSYGPVNGLAAYSDGDVENRPARPLLFIAERREAAYRTYNLRGGVSRALFSLRHGKCHALISMVAAVRLLNIACYVSSIREGFGLIIKVIHRLRVCVKYILVKDSVTLLKIAPNTMI